MPARGMLYRKRLAGRIYEVQTESRPLALLTGPVERRVFALAIFDDDERRDRPQPPSALRVATGRANGFVRWLS